jgi:hypothetical protein
MMEEKKKLSFKEQWLEVDKRCPGCNQITEKSKGISKQNLKRLITPRWDFNELLITFIIIMVIILAFSYKSETQQCRDWIAPMFVGDKNHCLMVCDAQCELIQGRLTSNLSLPNLTNAIKQINDIKMVTTNENK